MTKYAHREVLLKTLRERESLNIIESSKKFFNVFVAHTIQWPVLKGMNLEGGFCGNEVDGNPTNDSNIEEEKTHLSK